MSAAHPPQTASTSTPPSGARDGAAGSAPAPGRSTSLTVADVLANARAELLANSTLVTDPDLLRELDAIRREKWAELAHEDQS